MRKFHWHSERLVKLVARKKIVYIIVEGLSDDTALGVILNRIYNKNRVYVEITYGDITSDLSTNSSNIVSKIGNMINAYIKANHFKKSDF